MHRGKGFVVAAELSVALSTVAAAEPSYAHRVSVRVYDMAGIGVATTSTALATAEAALRSASIAVDWHNCAVPAATAPCVTPPTNVYVVRIVRTADARGRGPQPLGEALVDMTTGSAAFATIYFQRVHHLSRSAGADEARVLGYAIAHELGHLLMASHVHSDQGLMRPQWRERDLRRLRHADWQFSAEDAAAIRDRVESARVRSDIVWTTR
jgi:hypothetical protein